MSRPWQQEGDLRCCRFRAWVDGILALIPGEHCFNTGTMGINLFRTFNDVVTEPHRDNARYFVVYVLSKQGDGAETVLYDAQEPESAVYRTILEPGELVVVDDERFLHYVSPLTGEPRQRDVIVGMVYYPTHP